MNDDQRLSARDSQHLVSRTRAANDRDLAARHLGKLRDDRDQFGIGFSLFRRRRDTDDEAARFHAKNPALMGSWTRGNLNRHITGAGS